MTQTIYVIGAGHNDEHTVYAVTADKALSDVVSGALPEGWVTPLVLEEIPHELVQGLSQWYFFFNRWVSEMEPTRYFKVNPFDPPPWPMRQGQVESVSNGSLHLLVWATDYLDAQDKAKATRMYKYRNEMGLIF